MEVCRHLRWKGYDESLDPDEVAYSALLNVVPYQCLRTCQPWGIDDAPAGPEFCAAGRACFTRPGAAATPIDAEGDDR